MSANQPNMLSQIRKIFELFPKLGPKLRKGDCGRIAVFGGAPEYTGAPYFAALTPMKIGADLSYVFCHPSSAIVIKSYSPELIVHPGQEIERVETVINRIDSLVIGPGLGRDEKLVPTVKKLLSFTNENKKLFIVIDADGLFLVSKCLNELKGCSRVILTPNYREFIRLYESVFPKKHLPENVTSDHVKELANSLGVNICLKGVEDIITDGSRVEYGKMEGTKRRCGGQGDLLSGAIALFVHWARLSSGADNLTTDHILRGALSASDFIRLTSAQTFQKIGRSMNAADILANMRYVVQQYDIDVSLI